MHKSKHLQVKHRISKAAFSVFSICINHTWAALSLSWPSLVGVTRRNSSSTSVKSSGGGHENSSTFPEWGCLNPSNAAWRHGLSIFDTRFVRSPWYFEGVLGLKSDNAMLLVPPYVSSPSRGFPRYLACARIWWVRPVSNLHSTSADPPAQNTSLTLYL